MSLLNILLFSQSNKFDDTIGWSVDNIIDNAPDYHYTGNYAQNPVSKSIIHFFSNGDSHTYNSQRKVSAKLSLDKGVTFGTQFDLYVPTAPNGVIDSSGGYTANGRLHLFVGETTGTGAGQTRTIKYLYSDNDGTSWSSPDTIVTATSPINDGLLFPTPYTGIIENDGVLLKPFYKVTESGDLTESAQYLLRSIDGGSNWTYSTIRAKGTAVYSELDIIALSATDLISLIRDDDNGGYQQYYSDDNGLTWVSQGRVDFGDTFTGSQAPPSLRAFNINETRVIACYYYNRNTSNYRVIYAKASDLVSGTSGWDVNTKIQLLNFTTVGNDRCGYQGIAHFNNTLEAKGMIYKDDVATEDTQTYYYTLPTTQYQTLITELNL